MWGGCCPPALSPSGWLQLLGGNGEGKTGAAVMTSPVLVMPGVKLPGGNALLPSSSEVPMEGWWSRPFTAMVQGKQDSNFLSLFFSYKGKGTGDQCTYLPSQSLLAKLVVPNQNQGPWPSSPGTWVSLLAWQPDAHCTTKGREAGPSSRQALLRSGNTCGHSSAISSFHQGALVHLSHNHVFTTLGGTWVPAEPMVRA